MNKPGKWGKCYIWNCNRHAFDEYGECRFHALQALIWRIIYGFVKF